MRVLKCRLIQNSNDKYVAFFNTRDTGTSEISVTLAELGLKGKYTIKDLWSKENKGTISAKYVVGVDPHASVFLRFSKVK